MQKTNIPPQILQYYSPTLLSPPIPKFREDSEDLERFFKKACKLLEKKSASCKIMGKEKKCRQLIKEFEELYGKIKTKEKERQEEKTHFTQRPFYYFKYLGTQSEWLYGKFKYRERL